MAKSAAEKAAERMKRLDGDDKTASGSAVRSGLAKPSPTPKSSSPVKKRRQTIDFAVPDHDRLKRIAFEAGTDVGPMLRALALRTSDEEWADLLRSAGQQVSRSVGQ